MSLPPEEYVRDTGFSIHVERSSDRSHAHAGRGEHVGGLQGLHTWSPGDRVLMAVRRLAECTDASGPKLYRASVQALSEALGVRWAFMGEIPLGKPSKIKTVAAITDGILAENVEYELEGTPCAQVFRAGATQHYAGDLKAMFPHDHMLHELGATCYLGTPLRASNGSVLGVLNVLHDQPFQHALQPVALLELFAGRTANALELDRNVAQLHRNERNLADFFENAAISLHWVDAAGIITRANRAELEMMGYVGYEDEYVGRPVEDFHANPDEVRALLARLQAGETVRECPARLVRRDGSMRHVLITSNAKVEDGKIIHTRCFSRDVTEQREAEMALKDREQRYELVLAGAGAAIWDWDVPAKRVHYSPQWKRLRGCAEDELTDSEDEWKKHIHPDDVDRVMKAVTAHFEGRTEAFSEEYRVRHKDGRWIWILDRGLALRDDAGNVIRMAGSETDISKRKQAEEALRQSEMRFRTLVDVLPAGVYSCDADGIITGYNKRAAELWGREPKVGDPDQRFCGAFRLYHPDGSFLPHARIPMAEVLRTGRTVSNQEVILERPDGSRITVLINITPLLDTDGHVTGAINCFQDISRRKRDERLLRQRLDQLEILYQLSDAVGRAGSLESVYDAALDGLKSALGADRAAILLHDDQQVMRFVAWRGLSDQYRAAVEGHSPWSPDAEAPEPVIIEDVEKADLGELREVVRAEGIGSLGFFPLQHARTGRLCGKFMVYFDGPREIGKSELKLGGTIARHVAFAVERWRDHENLHRREQEFRALAERSPDIIARFDRDLRHLYVSPAIKEATGLDACSFIGKTKRDLGLPAAHCELWENACREVFDAGEAREIEFSFRPSGVAESRYYLSRITPEFGVSGDIKTVLAVSRDITQRRRAEEAQTWLAAIVETSQDAIISKTLDGVVTSWNTAAERLFGYTAEDMIGKPILRLIPPDRHGEERQILSTISGGGSMKPFETVRITKDGRKVDVLLTVSAVLDEHGRVIGASKIAHDITARKRAEEQLRENERRLKFALDAGRMGAWQWDVATNRVQWSPMLHEIHGIDPDSFGGTFDDFARDIHGEDRERILRGIESALCKGGEYRAEYRIVRPDGVERWLEARGHVIRDESGNAVRMAGVCMDVTGQKRDAEELKRHRDQLEQLVVERTVELEESYEQLRMSERMASLGTLSAGLGHDMGNLLLPLRLRLDAMERKLTPLPSADEFKDDLDAIRRCTEYMQRLTNGLRLFSLDPYDERDAGQVTDVSKWWSEVEPFLKNALPKHVELQRRFPEQPVKLQIAKHMLTQAVFNLVQNAADVAGKSHERCTGTTRVQIRLEIDSSRGKDGFARLGVADDGPGMSPDVVKRCMEPFFTTKPRGLSTGLGLALVHGIVQRVGGEVEIKSTLGEGSTFILCLPVSEERKQIRRHDRTRKDAAEAAAKSRGTAVLDVQTGRLRAFARSVLRSRGFDVLDAAEMRTSRLDEQETLLYVTDESEGYDASHAMQFTLRPHVVCLDPAAGRPGCWRALRAAVEEFDSRTVTACKQLGTSDVEKKD